TSDKCSPGATPPFRIASRSPSRIKSASRASPLTSGNVDNYCLVTCKDTGSWRLSKVVESPNQPNAACEVLTILRVRCVQRAVANRDSTVAAGARRGGRGRLLLRLERVLVHVHHARDGCCAPCVGRPGVAALDDGDSGRAHSGRVHAVLRAAGAVLPDHAAV